MTGDRADAAIAQPAYWADQITHPVRFADAVRALADQGCDLFLEIGAAPVLTRLGREILPERDPAAWIESLIPGEPESRQLADAAARLHVAGATIDWRDMLPDVGPPPVRLPTYPFQRRHHWLPDESSPSPASRGLERLETASESEASFAATLDPRIDAYLADHRVAGALWTPAATLLTLSAQALGALADGPVGIQDIRLLTPLPLAETETRHVRVIVALEAGGTLRLSARDAADGWQTHLSARALPSPPPDRPAPGLAALGAACHEPVSPDEVYRLLDTAGLEYGPRLRRLATLRRGNGEVLARIDCDPPEMTALLDPMALDACFQSLVALLPGDATSPLVPAAIERLVVERGESSGPLWCHARMRESPKGEPCFDLTLYHEQAARPRVRIEGLILRALAPARHRGKGTADGLLHQFQWIPAPLAPAGVDVGRIATELMSALDAPSRRSALADWSDINARLATAGGLVAAHALRELAGEDGTILATRSALQTRAGVGPRYVHLLARLYDIAQDAGLLRNTPAGLQLLESLPDPFGDWPADGDAPEFELLRACAPHIAGVLRGTIDPLALLFGGEGGGAAIALYREAAGLRMLNNLAAEAARMLADALPADSTLSLLEIGAGTGSTTAALLDALAGRRIDYHFTDVSALFLAEARIRFAATEGLRTAPLDIEADPLAQGFAPGGQDCVIAANVLHATRNLSETLGHIRSLIAPGGLLLLIEGTARTAFSDLTFGLTEGWWRFEDVGLREDHPLLDAAEWQALLAHCGFEDAVAVSPCSSDGKSLGQAIILARAPMATNRRWLLLADRGGTAAALAQIMGGLGDATLIDTPPSPAMVGPGTIIVDLRALDAPTAESLSDGAEAAQLGLSLGTGFADLIGAATRAAHVPRLVVVTRGAETATDHAGIPGLAQTVIRGMARVAALEHPELRPLRIDLDPATPADDVALLVEELVRLDLREEEIAFRQGRRLGGRIVPLHLPPPLALPPVGAARCVLAVEQPGDLSTLGYFERPRAALADDAIEIATEVTALHFRDLLTALDRAGCDSDSASLGTECCGIVTRTGAAVTNLAVGDRVVVLADGACSSLVVVPALRAVPCPAGLDPADAVDCGAYVTAERAIALAGGIRAGSRVLVQAGAGATGLAAIALAHMAGARTMATASPWKHPALRRRGVEALFHSRTVAFEDGVRAAGGVDLLLNSLTGDALKAGLRCLAPGGQFVELGLAELLTPEAVAGIRPDIGYHMLNLVEELTCDPARIRAIMADVVAQRARGTLPALPHISFPADRIGEAFRHLQSASQIGRILIDHRRRSADGAAIRPDATYLVTGGMGGLGLAIATWLVERGARSLVLAGRGPPGAEERRIIAGCEAAGAQVRVVRLDIADAQAVRLLLGEIATGPMPLRGVFHAAGLLHDATLLNLDSAGMAAVLHPKVAGAMELHRQTQDLQLDHFVLFSSAVALFGAPGQAAHAAANAFLDGLAVHRRSCGLPAHSIQWGAWASIGAAVRKHAEGPGHLPGLGQMAPENALAALDAVLLSTGSVSAALAVDWAALDAAIGPRPLLREVTRYPVGEAPVPNSPLAAPTKAALAALPPDEARARIADFVVAIVARVLGVPAGSAVRSDQGFFDMGMDSLTSLELRNTLQRAFGRTMPSMLTFDHPTVEALSAWLATDLLGETQEQATPAAPRAEVGATPEEIDELHIELARELETLTVEWTA